MGFFFVAWIEKKKQRVIDIKFPATVLREIFTIYQHNVDKKFYRIINIALQAALRTPVKIIDAIISKYFYINSCVSHTDDVVWIEGPFKRSTEASRKSVFPLLICKFKQQDTPKSNQIIHSVGGRRGVSGTFSTMCCCCVNVFAGMSPPAIKLHPERLRKILKYDGKPVRKGEINLTLPRGSRCQRPFALHTTRNQNILDKTDEHNTC